MDKTIYVIGHKNPDTDSIVSALAYAKLKNLMGLNEYKAARAGKLSPQTEYILQRFNVEPPVYLSDLLPKVAYYMDGKCETVNEDNSLWYAINRMQATNSKVVPVIDGDGKYKAFLHSGAFATNILSVLNPEKATGVSTSIGLIWGTLNAQPLNVVNEKEIFKCSLLIGGSTIETVKKAVDAHLSENLVVITGDRSDIIDYCISKSIKAIVTTSGMLPPKELTAKAKKSGTSVLVSPYDTASTVMLILYSTPVSLMADKKLNPVMAMDSVQKVRPLLNKSPSRSLPVIDDNNKVIGIISENDLLNEANVEVTMVDHNEMSQAIEGIEHYTIREIIDHHRIGNISTKIPITFINRPVGSTSTQIANMYRENRISIPIDIAQILLCGILSDTLVLQSATTTPVDNETAEYLSNITDLDIQALGRDIISAGSRITGRSASEVIKQDMKEYTENAVVYTVSQIEVDSTDEITNRKKEFINELEFERRSNKALFSVLLVTDITKLSSIMLVASDDKFMPFVTFPKFEDKIYYLKDVVSRKKQLIPLLTEQIKHYKS